MLLMMQKGDVGLWLDQRQSFIDKRIRRSVDIDKLITSVVVLQVDFPQKQAQWLEFSVDDGY